jgi:hypothetical protein
MPGGAQEAPGTDDRLAENGSGSAGLQGFGAGTAEVGPRGPLPLPRPHSVRRPRGGQTAHNAAIKLSLGGADQIAVKGWQRLSSLCRRRLTSHNPFGITTQDENVIAEGGDHPFPGFGVTPSRA